MKLITKLKILIPGLAFILVCSWIFLQLEYKLRKKTSKKIKKIRDYGNIKKNSYTPKNFLMIGTKITEKFDNREKIRLKLIRAGEPLKRIGINEKNYTSFKILFALVTMILMKNKNTQWVEAAVWGICGYAMIEWYIYMKIKKRSKLIEEEVDTLISCTIDFLDQGLNHGEIFSMMLEKIGKKNPLYKEIAITNIKIAGSSVNSSIDQILTEMQERVGVEDIDNYCLALKQYDEVGKAKKMLKKQLELIRSSENQKKKRETQYRANLNSAAIAMFVICIVIIVMVPMIVTALENPIFKK